MGQNPYHSIISAKTWWRHYDSVFYCIVIKYFGLRFLILPYFITKFVNIECRLHGQKNRLIFLNLGGGEIAFA